MLLMFRGKSSVAGLPEDKISASDESSSGAY